MAINSLSPYFLKFLYTSNGHPHTHIVPTDAPQELIPGDEPFWDVLGTEVTLTDFLTDYMVVVRPLFAATSEWQTVEAWQQLDPESDPSFIYALSIGLAGTNVGAVTPFSQITMTFRTNAGGIFKPTFMEIVGAVNTVNPAPFGGNAGAYSTFLTSDPVGNGIVRGRDGGRIIAPIRAISKTNDALRKKYLLSG